MRAQAARQARLGDRLFEQGVEPGDENFLGAVEVCRSATQPPYPLAVCIEYHARKCCRLPVEQNQL